MSGVVPSRQRVSLKRPAKAELLADVLRRLEVEHGPRPFKVRGRGLDVLVMAMLSQNTSSANAARGYRILKRDLPTWEKVLAAPVEIVQRCIGVCGLGRMRARRLQAMLAEIKRDRGRLSLAFLGRLPREEAWAYLAGFHGIGPKTIACTLLFAFGLPVFPVDKGIHRVVRRLGLIGPRDGELKASEVVERHTPASAEVRYPLHVLLYTHAKTHCRPKNPLCEACPLLDLCPHGRRRTKGRPTGELHRRIARTPGAGLPKWVDEPT